MKKIIIQFFLLISVYSFAQKSENGRTFHFDLEMKIITESNNFKNSIYKYINTKDDTFFAISTKVGELLILEYKNNKIHHFSIKNNNYHYQKSNNDKPKLNFIANGKIEIKKESNNKYTLKNSQEDLDEKSTIVIIINLEKSNFSAANSLGLNEIMNLNIKHLKKLRKKEKNSTFIIRNYRAIYKNGDITNATISNEKKIDITLSIPKTLIEKSENTP